MTFPRFQFHLFRQGGGRLKPEQAVSRDFPHPSRFPPHGQSSFQKKHRHDPARFKRLQPSMARVLTGSA